MGMKKTTTVNKNVNNHSSHISLSVSEHNHDIEKKIKKKKKELRLQPAPVDSLIRVLRPKVYITDSAAFKSLVQQLTGNGTAATIPSDPDILIEPAAEEAPVPGTGSVTGEPEEMMSSMFFNDYSPVSDNQQLGFLDEYSPSQSDDRSSYDSREPDHHHQTTMSGPPTDDNSSLLSDDLDMLSNMFSYQDLESWLLDLGPPQISVYDYPLTELFWFSSPEFLCVHVHMEHVQIVCTLDLDLFSQKFIEHLCLYIYTQIYIYIYN